MSSTITEGYAIRETMNFHAVHPGKILKEELASRGLSAAAFALLLRVPQQRIQEIVAGKRAISPETALRIGVALGTGGRIWLAMQQAADLRKAEIAMGDKIRAEVQSALKA
jgi:addiction module HigA family antidote